MSFKWLKLSSRLSVRYLHAGASALSRHDGRLHKFFIPQKLLNPIISLTSLIVFAALSCAFSFPIRATFET